MSPNSINQQTVTTTETRNYSTNDNASVPLSSTPPPPTSPTTTKNLVHQTSNIAIDEQNFPRLPSPPQGVYD
jgi:hypothetical protein